MLIALLMAMGMLTVVSVPAEAADLTLPGVAIEIGDGGEGGQQGEIATAIKVLLVLTVLSLAPGLLIMVTSFTRIIVVLAMLRQAFGMQETPPTPVLISLALFLTLFSMAPVVTKINQDAFSPYVEGEISESQALEHAAGPLRSFMLAQVREKDLALMFDLAKTDAPDDIAEVGFVHLIPAFMLSELKTAFQIGFVIFLPFLLIDLVVAAILMSLGMLMVPPMMISLPVKVMMFVLIDGWYLVVKSLLGSFS